MKTGQVNVADYTEMAQRPKEIDPFGKEPKERG